MRTFIEVFAGCGGLSTGLTDAGWDPLLLVDNDKHCMKTLFSNKPKDIVSDKSVKDLHLNAYKGRVSLLAGGIPCQAFSHAGLRKGTDDERGALFFDFIRLIQECEPHMFLVENVVGLTTHDSGKTFADLLKLLSLDGRYHVAWKILNANDHGVAQKRKRVFIIGRSAQLFPQCDDDTLYPPVQSRKPVLRDALQNCPVSTGAVYTAEKKRIMDMIPPGGCWINLPVEEKEKFMGKAFTSGGGKRGMARRISWDEPCLTLTTSPCQKQTERCHPDETRPFTVREYARIQTFPDTYQFSGTVQQQYKQIGNAVPVMLGYHVGKHLLDYYTAALIEL